MFGFLASWPAAGSAPPVMEPIARTAARAIQARAFVDALLRQSIIPPYPWFAEAGRLTATLSVSYSLPDLGPHATGKDMKPANEHAAVLFNILTDLTNQCSKIDDPNPGVSGLLCCVQSAGPLRRTRLAPPLWSSPSIGRCRGVRTCGGVPQGN
jgi:hypothetical protein